MGRGGAGAGVRNEFMQQEGQAGEAAVKIAHNQARK